VDRHARPVGEKTRKNKKIVEIVVEMCLCCVTIMETLVLFFCFYGGLPDALNSRRQVFSFSFCIFL
jgi:hypothetical protein